MEDSDESRFPHLHLFMINGYANIEASKSTINCSVLMNTAMTTDMALKIISAFGKSPLPPNPKDLPLLPVKCI